MQFALIGPNALAPASTELLEAIGNVHVLGPRPYEDVPAYLQHASVLIVPHVLSPFTESLDPIKAYECLAVDTPTVATPVAGFRGLNGSITTADSADYVHVLRAVIDRDPSLARSSRDARIPSWSDRAGNFDAALTQASRPHAPKFDPHVRVVYVGHTARASGGELALARLLPALDHLGVDAHVILGEAGPIVDQLRARNITVEVLPFAAEARELHRDRVTLSRLPLRSAALTARYTWQLAQRIKELRPEIVHTNTLKAAIYGGVAGRLAGVPVVWHIRDRIAPDYLPRSSVLALRFLAWVIPQAVITNSRATRATLGALESRAAVVPSPVTYDAVERPIPTTATERSTFTVGIVGRLSPWKGQHVFLEGFAAGVPKRTGTSGHYRRRALR